MKRETSRTRLPKHFQDFLGEESRQFSRVPVADVCLALDLPIEITHADVVALLRESRRVFPKLCERP